MSNNLYSIIFNTVSLIPKGKVSTYKTVSDKVNIILKTEKINKTCTARIVGNALHTNTDTILVPCHRVIKNDGTLALGYAYGGIEKQKEKLTFEGIKFSENNKVDLSHYKHSF